MAVEEQGQVVVGFEQHLVQVLDVVPHAAIVSDPAGVAEPVEVEQINYEALPSDLD